MKPVKKSIDERTQRQRAYDIKMNDRRMQSKEKKKLQIQEVQSNTVHESKVGSIVIENTCPRKENGTSEAASSKIVNRSGNDTHAVDANKEPMAKEKVFANAALKNELRNLKGNSVDTKFEKASILGKPPLQPFRNHSVVRQPNAFKSEQLRISQPWFASQVDVKHNLPKPVTPYYIPKVRESAFAKPHHVNAPSSSRNSKKESYGYNDIAHNHHLDEARKKTQERNRNSSFFRTPKTLFAEMYL
nr:hypothetical protein [Tanacetum cinerariifolium]